jgi:hypothetical protein
MSEELLKQLETEKKELEGEFIQLGKEIKNCKDSETRKKLQELKKEIQFDLDEVKIQIDELIETNKEQQTNTNKNDNENGTEKP